MAVIYLRHPKHGEKVACNDLEAQMDRENGWEDFDPNESADEEEEVPAFLATPPARRSRRQPTQE